jgi:DNA-binding Lrp family transcriptional regulator
MDDIDHQLIAMLCENARLPVATLAKKIGVTRTTVQNRLARLERDGVIAGYTLRLRPAVEGRTIRAMMTIASDGHQASEVLHALQGNPSVAALHMTNGRWDIVAELRVDTLELFERALRDIRRLKGIAQSETNILLSTHKG